MEPWIGSDDILAFEEALGVPFDYVLHVGDFGIWPDPERVDKATRKHDGAGNFPVWFAEDRAAPRPTVFIKGNHEDFVWLDEQLKTGRRAVLSSLTYLPSGDAIDIGESRERIRIGGVGGPLIRVSDAKNLRPGPQAQQLAIPGRRDEGVLRGFCVNWGSSQPEAGTVHPQSSGEVRRLLKRYSRPMAFHAVRTFFLGSTASPKSETRPRCRWSTGRRVTRVRTPG